MIVDIYGMRYPLNESQQRKFIYFIKKRKIDIKITPKTKIIKIPPKIWKEYEKEIINIVYNPHLSGYTKMGKDMIKDIYKINYMK